MLIGCTFSYPMDEKSQYHWSGFLVCATLLISKEITGGSSAKGQEFIGMTSTRTFQSRDCCVVDDGSDISNVGADVEGLSLDIVSSLGKTRQTSKICLIFLGDGFGVFIPPKSINNM